MRVTSCGCRPVVGSSNTYVVSVSAEPRWRTIFTRWASPPDNVPAGRSSDRYPRPISTNASSTPLRFSSSGATEGSSSPRTQSRRSVTCIRQASAMLTPPMRAFRAPSARRVPSQSGHVVNVASRSTKARTCGCRASTSLDSIDLRTFGTSPS